MSYRYQLSPDGGIVTVKKKYVRGCEKYVKCKVCNKQMQENHLTRHLKTHKVHYLTKPILHPWQRDLFQLVRKPSTYEVIWIIGSSPCEGRKFFQSYVESQYTKACVVRLNLGNAPRLIFRALAKRPMLNITDKFLFTLSQKDQQESQSCYSILEQIRNGGITQNESKKILRLPTRNVIIIVFAEGVPELDKVTQLGLKLFHINKNELIANECHLEQ